MEVAPSPQVCADGMRHYMVGLMVLRHGFTLIYRTPQAGSLAEIHC